MKGRPRLPDRSARDLAAAKRVSKAAQAHTKRETALITALQHIADVALADEGRDLPGIRQTALTAIAQAKT